MNKYILTGFFCVLITALSAQMDERTGLACALGKMQLPDRVLAAKSLRYPGDSEIDVRYYFLNLDIDPNEKSVKGEVRIDFEVLSTNKNSFDLDLIDAYTVDSVLVDGLKMDFEHSGDQIHVEVPAVFTPGNRVETRVFYRGNPPQESDSFSIVFDENQYGDSVIWTLSEPFDAPSWWPCVDNQADKADSCDVWITLPEEYTAVSQGLLEELIVHENGTRTAKWKHRYPIAHYLISLAASNYTQLTQYYVDEKKDSMRIDDFLYPETAKLANVNDVLALTPEFIALFSSVYGEYPFIKEKYGHAMFGYGGGMEHQTVSSMGGFGFGIVAHELAHQWFGDKVTCKTWRDIWVNEGFAEFSALYANEKHYGRQTYDALVNAYMQSSKAVTGSIAIEDPTSVNAIFDYTKTYLKGSVVLHMLRGVLGDETFFATLKEYQNTEFAYGAASIEDFQAVAERVYGQSLQWFFDEWLFGKGYPKYITSWNQTGNKLFFDVNQAGSHAETPLFTMPIEIQLNYEDGTQSIEKVWLSEAEEQFEFDISQAVNAVLFDPNNLIMKDWIDRNETDVLGTFEEATHIEIYPNPSEDKIRIENKTNRKFDNFRIYDSSGRVYRKSAFTSEIDIRSLSAGKYFLQLQSEDKAFVKSFIKR
ncbi:T9SS type A sorting domain-containing protein [Marinilongibacter aquaticus]|uniref:M1 family aminopeptidase n=1 Tax=Marinilongibacter aquaticus TaxID=2975157 RepID=UPI0021BD00B5|nr:M1 family aminopeptidase [Marinilongibacter aquaticus]UBM58040.1 T9SS type A sorting domain-containing protein [Marinilongibacter aquaticus]